MLTTPELPNPREFLVRELTNFVKWMCQQSDREYSAQLVRRQTYRKWSAHDSYHYEKLGKWKEEEHSLEKLIDGCGHTVPVSYKERLKLQVLSDVLAPVTTSALEVVDSLLSVYHSTRENQLLLYEVIQGLSILFHDGYPPSLLSSLPDKLKEINLFKKRVVEVKRFTDLFAYSFVDPYYYAVVSGADQDEINVDDFVRSWERDMTIESASDFQDVGERHMAIADGSDFQGIDDLFPNILEQRLRTVGISDQAISVAQKSLQLCLYQRMASDDTFQFHKLGKVISEDREELKQRLDNLPFLKDKQDFTGAENFFRFLQVLKYQDRHGSDLSRTTAENELWECTYLTKELGKKIDIVTHFIEEGANRQCYGAIDSGGRELAVSVMKQGRIRRDAADNEVDALFKLDHPSIVKYLSNGVLQDGRPYIITKKFGIGETLYSFMERHQRPLTLREFLTIFYGSDGKGVLDALIYAHGEYDPKGVRAYHGDCSARNILLQLDEQGDVLETRIADWESAIFVSDSKKVKPHSSLGSSAYTLPGLVGASEEGDRFSLAITMYAALTGTHPLLQKKIWEVKTNGDEQSRLKMLGEMAKAYQEWKITDSTLHQRAQERILWEMSGGSNRGAESVLADGIMEIIDKPQQKSLTYIYSCVKLVYDRISSDDQLGELLK